MKLSHIYAVGTLSFAIITGGVAAGGGTYIGFMFSWLAFFIMMTLTGSKGA